jgi:hypothetical protein
VDEDGGVIWTMLVLAEEFYLSVKHHINDLSLISPTARSIWIGGTISDRLSIHNKYLKVLDSEDKR